MLETKAFSYVSSVIHTPTCDIKNAIHSDSAELCGGWTSGAWVSDGQLLHANMNYHSPTKGLLLIQLMVCMQIQRASRDSIKITQR